MPFQKLILTDTSYPLFTLVNLILDVDSSLFTSQADTYISKLPQEYQSKELSSVKAIVTKKVTPLANLIYVSDDGMLINVIIVRACVKLRWQLQGGN